MGILLRELVRECVHDVLHCIISESHAVRMWHYTGFSDGLSIISSNEFRLSQNDGIEDDSKEYDDETGKWYDEDDNVCVPPRYMLCTTRARDSRVGFSSCYQYGNMKYGRGICRIELDEFAIENSPLLVVRSESDCVQHSPHIDSYDTRKWDLDDGFGQYTSNWENQHEERILSKVPVICDASHYIRRIDFLVSDKSSLLSLRDVLNNSKAFSGKVFVYGNMNDFNSANGRYISLSSLNESVSSDDLHYMLYDDAIVFFNGNNEEVGELCYSISSVDGVYSEYGDSVDGFDAGILRKFSHSRPVVNIEDVFISRKYQGNGLFREIMSIGMELLSGKYSQFILRACSDNGFPENKLVEIYLEYGFVPYQETDDGVIMYLIK